MANSKRWSEQAITRNRRKRLARRLYRDQPLFATDIISKRFSIVYTSEHFFADQLLKTGYTKRQLRGKKKSTGKSRLLDEIARNIHSLLSQDSINEHKLSKQISRHKLLFSVRSQPWKVEVRKSLTNGERLSMVFFLSVKYSHHQVKQFTSKLDHLIEQGSSRQQLLEYYDDFTAYD